MIVYELLSTVVQRISPPKARKLAGYSLKLASMLVSKPASSALRREVMGLAFPGPVGLAAGFDKHGELYSTCASLGFGFSEIGSVIPQPEPQRSRGLDTVAAILSRYPRPHAIPLGISISMNRKTPMEKVPADYMICMEKLWKYADYMTINLGVRAGPDLHQPEHRSTLGKVFAAVKNQQKKMAEETGLHRPVVVKVDQCRADTANLLACVRDFSFDGLVLSGEEGDIPAALEKAVVSMAMPVISVGGIRTPQDAACRLAAGAQLVQVYTGVVRSGPLLFHRINQHLVSVAG